MSGQELSRSQLNAEFSALMVDVGEALDSEAPPVPSDVSDPAAWLVSRAVQVFDVLDATPHMIRSARFDLGDGVPHPDLSGVWPRPAVPYSFGPNPYDDSRPSPGVFRLWLEVVRDPATQANPEDPSRLVARFLRVDGALPSPELSEVVHDRRAFDLAWALSAEMPLDRAAATAARLASTAP